MTPEAYVPQQHLEGGMCAGIEGLRTTEESR